MRKAILLIASLTVSSLYGAEIESNGKVLSSPAGKYVFGQISQARADQYLINTETGEIWTKAVDPKGNEFLEPLFFDRGAHQFSLTPNGQAFTFEPKEENKDWAGVK